MVGSALHRDSKERYKPIVWLGRMYLDYKCAKSGISYTTAAAHISTERRRVHILHRQEKILRLLRPSTRRMTCLCAGCSSHIPEIEPAPFSVDLLSRLAVCIVRYCNTVSLQPQYRFSCHTILHFRAWIVIACANVRYVAITFTYFRVPRALSESNGGRRADC